MQRDMVQFNLSFEGSDADKHQIDFYDVARALIGFQRSLAMTTHLVLNDKVITQAPALQGAQILALPPEEGSWKFAATVLTGLYFLGTAPHDTPIGHIIYSAYDHVISESLGFHVDYDKTLGKQYEELKEKENKKVPILNQGRFDSVIEKCAPSIIDMHRPIVKSETAITAKISAKIGKQELPFKQSLDQQTYDYMYASTKDTNTVSVKGRISGYNLNTYSGRIYLEQESRPIPFELAKDARHVSNEILLANSLNTNAADRFHDGGYVMLDVFRVTSRNGKLKKYIVVNVTKA